MEGSQALNVLKPPSDPMIPKLRAWETKKTVASNKRLPSRLPSREQRVADLGSIIKIPTQRAKWGKAAAAKLENLGLIPETHVTR